MGDVIKADDVRYVFWPTSALDARYVRRDRDHEAKDGFVGRHWPAGLCSAANR